MNAKPLPKMKMSKYKTEIPQASRAKRSESRTDLSVSLKDSGGGRTSAVPDKKRKTNRNILVSTYNIRTMRLEEHLLSLEKELQTIKWDILGISETRMKGEANMILKSGHVLFQRNSETGHHIGGVAIMVNSRIKHLVTKSKAISDRVIYIMLHLNRVQSIQIIQAYAPTSASTDEDVEQFYEDLTTAKNQENTKFKIIMGDFNAKVGQRTATDGLNIGNFGLGTRNIRGEMLLDFLNKEQMYCMNTFFKKQPQRKWTWRSPDGAIKNEIDYILTTDKQLCTDVSVLNRFNTGSDHRIVRATISINTHLERKKQMEKIIRPTSNQLKEKIEDYNAQINKKLEPTENLRNLTLNEIAVKIVGSIKVATKSVCSMKAKADTKLSKNTNELLAERRKTDRDSAGYPTLDRKVKKAIRKDLRSYNTQTINEAIENNMNMKVLRSKRTKGKSLIYKIKNQQGEVVTERQQITSTIQQFYSGLYRQSVPKPNRSRIQMVQNVGSEDIPEVDTAELRMALKQMKNRKAPGEDLITVEMLKNGGKTLEKALIILFNRCLEEGKIPDTWRNAEVIILFKKGDRTNIENYRPISLLSVLYKLLSKIITNRLNNKFDFYQPVEQAGFRSSFSTLDHIQTIRTLIEKCTEYNVPLHLAFVDYKKAFDSLETWAVMEAMSNARIDSRYTNLIEDIYKDATLHVKIDENTTTDKIPIQRGVRQGDSISPKLFTLALEDVFKKLSWQQKGVNIDGRYLNHLRFADDIVLMSTNAGELSSMLLDLKEASQIVGLEMNLQKTKIMSPDNICVTVDNKVLEVVEEYIYLGHNIMLGKNNQTAEIGRRIRLAWAAFGNLAHILKEPKMPINLKRKVFDACVLPVMLYGLETVTLTKKSAQRLRVCQRAMERAMLGISLRDRQTNENIRAKTRVSDAVEQAARSKWRWAGHVARNDVKWTKIIMQWRPRLTKRSVGRPLLRWRDDIQRRAGKNWILTAQCRTTWKRLEEAYVQEWTQTG